MRRATLLPLVLCLLYSPGSSAQVARSPQLLSMQRVPVTGGELEYKVSGGGEPVLLIHGAFVAGSWVSFMDEPSVANYRLIRYHQRGFAGSRAPRVPLERQVDDAVALLRHLGIERAHIVGHSGGGRIALQIALDAPDVVHSLLLLEPAGVGPVPSGPKFAAEILDPAFARYRSGDPAGATDVFMQGVAGVGPDWRAGIARTIPGGPEQAAHDAATFFDDPTPPTAFVFDAQKARKLSPRIPILYLWGSETIPVAKEGKELFHSWFPQAEYHIVEGAGHSLQMQAPRSVAVIIADFLRRHPLPEKTRK